MNLFKLKIIDEKSNHENRVVISLMLLVMVAILSLPAFRNGIYEGFDVTFHMGRIQSIAEELSAGHFPARYESNAYYGYGYISSIMYPNIFLYIPAGLYILGLPLYRAYNLYIILVNFAGVFIAYYSFKRVYRDSAYGFLATIIYNFAAYRFSNIYLRTALGEYTAMIFIPLLVYGIYKLYYEDKAESLSARLAPTIISAFGLIESHILTTMMVAIFIALFAVANFSKTKEIIGEIIISLIFIFLTNAFFIIPFIQTYISEDMIINTSMEEVSEDIQGEGLYLRQFFRPFSEGRGSDISWSAEHEEFLALGLGVLLCIVFFIGTILFRKRYVNSTEKESFKAALIVFVLGILAAWMSTVYFPWNLLAKNVFTGSLLCSVQFPWRYLLIQTICFTLSGVYAIRLIIGTLQKKYLRICTMIFVCIAMLQSVIFFRYLSMANTTISPVAISDETIWSDNLYLLYGTDVDKLQESLDIEENDGKILLPLFGYKNIKLWDESGREISWHVGDNNRVEIDMEDYPHVADIDYAIPLGWRLSEILSLVSIIACIIILIKNRKGSISYEKLGEV